MYDKIIEVIEEKILEAKKEALHYAHMEKYSEVNGGDGCHEYNCMRNAQDSLTEYLKILNFVERCEDDWNWLIGIGVKPDEMGVGKSNFGTLNYPNKENPIIFRKTKDNDYTSTDTYLRFNEFFPEIEKKEDIHINDFKK